MKIAFIGGGNMARALIVGMLGKVVKEQQLIVIDPQPECCSQWKEKGIIAHEHASSQLSECDIWVLAVKPQMMTEVAKQIKPYLRSQTLLVSIAAGLSLQYLGALFGTKEQPWLRLIRVMPNTPALVGKGASGLLATPAVRADEVEFIQQILTSVGQVVICDNEQQLNAVTALSGSGPAYVFLFIEAMIEGGTTLGLSHEQAKTLALQTLLGASMFGATSNEEPSRLRENVTSKGGTTAAALQVFEDREFKAIIKEAMVAAAKRAVELASNSN